MHNKVTQETIDASHKPFDIVSDIKGNVGFIREVSCNECQPDARDQISYAVTWLTGDNNKTAWFYHNELTSHCNILIKIAESACHPFGNNEKFVSRFFGTKSEIPTEVR